MNNELEQLLEEVRMADMYGTYSRLHDLFTELQEEKETLEEQYQSLLDLKQQEISVLESKVCELEANEEKLKREWYVMGSNDNFKALLDSGAIQQ